MFISSSQRFLVVALVLLSLVSAPLALAGRQQVGFIDAEQAKASPQTLANKYIKVEGMSGSTFGRKPKINDFNKVAIGSFKVLFQETWRYRQTKGGVIEGIKSGNWQPSTTVLNIYDLDEPTMQAITNQAYADFVADLEAAGIEVVDQQTLLDSAPNYKAYVEETQAEAFSQSIANKTIRRDKDGTNMFYTAVPEGGFPIAKPSTGFLKNFTPGVQALTRDGEANKLIKAAVEAQTDIVTVTYFLDTLKVTGTGDVAFVKKGEADNRFVLGIRQGSNAKFYKYKEARSANRSVDATMYNFVSYQLKNRMNVPDDIGEGKFLKENYGTQVLGAALNWATGSAPKVTRMRKYELYVDPAGYEAAGVKLLDLTNDLIASEIKEAKAE